MFPKFIVWRWCHPVFAGLSGPEAPCALARRGALDCLLFDPVGEHDALCGLDMPAGMLLCGFRVMCSDRVDYGLVFAMGFGDPRRAAPRAVAGQSQLGHQRCQLGDQIPVMRAGIEGEM